MEKVSKPKTPEEIELERIEVEIAALEDEKARATMKPGPRTQPENNLETENRAREKIQQKIDLVEQGRVVFNGGNIELAHAFLGSISVPLDQEVFNLLFGGKQDMFGLNIECPDDIRKLYLEFENAYSQFEQNIERYEQEKVSDTKPISKPLQPATPILTPQSFDEPPESIGTRIIKNKWVRRLALALGLVTAGYTVKKGYDFYKGGRPSIEEPANRTKSQGKKKEGTKKAPPAPGVSQGRPTPMPARQPQVETPTEKEETVTSRPAQSPEAKKETKKEEKGKTSTTKEEIDEKTRLEKVKNAGFVETGKSPDRIWTYQYPDKRKDIIYEDGRLENYDKDGNPTLKTVMPESLKNEFNERYKKLGIGVK